MFIVDSVFWIMLYWIGEEIIFVVSVSSNVKKIMLVFKGVFKYIIV